MTDRTILAAADNSPAARPVIAVARALTPLFDATVEVLHVVENGHVAVESLTQHEALPLRVLHGDPITSLLTEAENERVVAVVLGTQRIGPPKPVGGHVAERIATTVGCPVALVPPRLRLPYELRSALLPLEGTEETSASTADLVRSLHDLGVRVVPLHVHTEASVPSYTDEPQHDTRAWVEEFMVRYGTGADTEALQLRYGAPPTEMLNVAASIGADLIVLTWLQAFDSHRAKMVREAIAAGTIPVLLLPPRAPAEHGGPARIAHAEPFV